LDDILLFFFSEFKKLSLQKVISEPKSKSENFTQKINSYFSSIEKPFLIVLDSFESILKENRQEILDFIFHLSSFSKVKIILISRSFEDEYFENVDIKYQRITVLALEKHLFEKYLKTEKIKCTSAILDELYRQTRGYFFFTALVIKIMKHRELTLEEFLKEFKTSFLKFDDFLVKQALDLIPASSRNLFWFISMVRHPVSIDLLKAIKLYDKANVGFLVDNLIFTQDNSLVYIQDYFKEHVDVTVAPNISHRIHSFIVELYKTQLPLKPLERNFLISRQTMRKEIEYHQIFLPRRPKAADGQNIDVNYLSYAKGIEFDYSHLKPKDEPSKAAAKKEESGVKYVPVDLSAVKNTNLNLKELPFLDTSEVDILGNRGNKNAGIEPRKDLSYSLGKEPPSFEQDHFDEPVKEYSLSELLGFAKNAEDAYRYAKAVEFYKKAMLCQSDADYQASLPLVYKGLANCYAKSADNENAISYYDLARKFYEKLNDLIEANSIKLELARIFYETYRFEKSRETLLDSLNYEQNPAEIKTKAYLQLANLEENLSNPERAFEYYKQALTFADESMDIEILSELYFKYALTLDDKDDTKNAIEFYEKCIKLSDDFNRNKFLSSAYSNIATLYFERSDSANAVKNYLKAYEIDKHNNNYDGMYYSASKLASTLQRKYPDEALKYFKIALESAEFTNDNFYIASASLAIGDFYCDKKHDEVALKHFVNALNLVKNEFSKENLNKIQMRINDIKYRLGEEKFEEVMEILREEG
jgi:tetratricopeptide (TPR) repeat protein